MHSSRMRTARSLTVSCLILRTPPHNHSSPSNHACPCNHACQPATTYAPSNHAHPPATMHAPQQPHTPPSNHAHPPQPHTPQQPCTHWQTCMPPQATTHAPPMNRMTDRCKNIALPQTSFAGGNKIEWKFCCCGENNL